MNEYLKTLQAAMAMVERAAAKGQDVAKAAARASIRFDVCLAARYDNTGRLVFF